MNLALQTTLAFAMATAVATATADVIPGTGTPSATNLGLSDATQLVSAPAGLGHVLLLPYFSAQNGNATLMSITNTDMSNGKALKVSFRGASNGDSLLELVVLLAPGDTWTATLSTGADGVAQIVTVDKTCTLPKLPAGAAQTLLTGRLNNPAWPATEKGNQTREGYVQVINMADIPDAAHYGTGLQQSPLFLAIQPFQGKHACTEHVLHAALVQSNHITEPNAAAQGFAAPTGGLGGKWTVINVPQTTTYSGSMHALRAANASGADARANFVAFPPVDTAYGGNISQVTADPLLRPLSYTGKTWAGSPSGGSAAAALSARNLDLPDLSTPYIGNVSADAALVHADRVTAALAARTLFGEYFRDAIIHGATDWTFSMPARRHSVAMDYSAAPVPRRLFSTVPPSGNQWFHEGNVTVHPVNKALACTGIDSFIFTDRDATIKSSGTVFMGPPPPVQLCGAIGALSFLSTSSTSPLSAMLTREDSETRAFVNGWGRLDLSDHHTSLGLPVIGSSFIKAVNPSAAPGVSGTYGLTAEHWYKR